MRRRIRVLLVLLVVAVGALTAPVAAVGLERERTTQIHVYNCAARHTEPPLEVEEPMHIAISERGVRRVEHFYRQQFLHYPPGGHPITDPGVIRTPCQVAQYVVQGWESSRSMWFAYPRHFEYHCHWIETRTTEPRQTLCIHRGHDPVEVWF